MDSTLVTTAPQIIHDTVKVLNEQHGWVTSDLAKYLYTGIGTLLSGWVAKYILHDRKKAKDAAFVSTTTAEAKAEVAVAEAESRAQVAVHRSAEEIIKVWEQRAKDANEEASKLRVSLDVLQAQLAEMGKYKELAEGRLQLKQEKIDVLSEAVQRLENRIEEQKEQLIELALLRNHVQTLQAKCAILQAELKETINLVQP